jgi:hypothetical protein
MLLAISCLSRFPREVLGDRMPFLGRFMVSAKNLASLRWHFDGEMKLREEISEIRDRSQNRLLGPIRRELGTRRNWRNVVQRLERDSKGDVLD